MKLCIIQTTCASQKEAKKIAKILIEKKLAACVQITKIQSVYMWKEKLCRDKERLLFIKSKRKHFKKIENEIKKNHSYDLPEIIEIKITKASKEYSQFIDENTK